MSWTERQNIHNLDGVHTWDSFAGSSGTFNATITAQTPTQDLLGALLTFRGSGGIPQYVQSKAQCSAAAVNATSVSLTFTVNVTAGNSILIDFGTDNFYGGGLAGFFASLTVSDNQGNTYTNISKFGAPGTGDFTFCWLAQNCAAGATTVTVATSFAGVNAFITWGMCVTEYSRIGSFQAVSTSSDIHSTGTCAMSALGTVNGLLHLFSYIHGYVSTTAGGGGADIPTGWLITRDGPGTSFVDRTSYMFYGEGHQNTFSQQVRERGQATIHLRIRANDTYQPTRGSQVYLYDDTSSGGFTLQFSGLVQDIELDWIGTDGDRYFLITAVSLESVFDTVYASPTQYVAQTCGDIVTSLFNLFETGCPVTLGTISAGATIALLNTDYEKLSDLFDQLATTSGFTWWVDPATQKLNFCSPALVPAPFTVANEDILWDSFSWKQSGADYRNRQAIRVDYEALGLSGEFIVGAGQTSITLSRPVNQVTAAYATLSTCNTALGTFSGQPADGDTITIGPATGAWQGPSHVYGLGGIIVINGYVQKVTTAGTSGLSQPTFSTLAGQTTVDGSVIWTCLGALGLSTGQITYTFKNAIDNRQFGQVLIDGTTAQNLVDAINATVTRAGAQLRGVKYSLPTWENPQINAINLSGGQFTAQTKVAGTGTVTALSESTANFVWSAASTSGGTSPQGSLGPHEGATISLAVYVSGTSTSAPGLSYTPGSAVINMATPLNAGSNLNIYYTRADGNVIEVEDTALVTAYAAITGGTGKVQQITDASSQGLISTSAAAALQLAQQALAAFSTPPISFEFRTYRPGLAAGQQVTVLMTLPTGGTVLLNGTWVIESLQGDLVAVYPWLGSFGDFDAGHYLYTARVVNLSEVGSSLDFWKSQGGGGSGSGGGLVATSGGALAPSSNSAPFPQDFSRRVNSGTSFTSGSTAGWNDVQYKLADFASSTSLACTFSGQFDGAYFKGGDFTGSTFTGSFIGCDFTTANLTGCTLSGDFTGCTFDTAVLTNAILTGANLTGCTFKSCTLTNATFTTANLEGSSWNACTFVTTAPTFSGANFTAARFCDLATGGGFRAVQSITANRTLKHWDANVLFENAVQSPTVAVTVTLPAAAPSGTWACAVQNVAGVSMTLSPNGLLLDGSSASLTLLDGQGVQIFSDGTNYFTVRGLGASSTLGTVTSVGLAAPAEFTVSGSPVTAAGTLTLTKATQAKNLIYAGPTSGANAQPTFRAAVTNDYPKHSESLTDGASNFIFAAGDIVTVVGVPN